MTPFQTLLRERATKKQVLIGVII